MIQTMTQNPPTLREGDILWRPEPAEIGSTRLAQYQEWVARRQGRSFADYQALWQWSVDELEAFWESVWDFFEVQSDGERQPVLASWEMPGATWYPNIVLNYAEHVFRNATPLRPALIAHDEGGKTQEVSWEQLRRDTAALAASLRRLGVTPGDRVASYLPNRVEAVVAFLACASIGAVWSSCAPDMGPTVVFDRLRQIEPCILLAADSYSYNGKVHDRAEVVEQLLAQL